MPARLRPRPWTADEYHRLIEVGILGEDDRIELIEGEIVAMSPIGQRHVWAVIALTRLLSQAIGDRALVSIQNPLHLPGSSEPQPDVALLVWPDDLEPALPSPTEVLLVIEVADSSVEVDREVKIPLYGRAGIVEAWLVDLVDGTVEVSLGPSAAGYDTTTSHHPGDTVSPTALPGVAIPVADILSGPSPHR